MCLLCRRCLPHLCLGFFYILILFEVNESRIPDIDEEQIAIYFLKLFNQKIALIIKFLRFLLSYVKSNMASFYKSFNRHRFNWKFCIVRNLTFQYSIYIQYKGRTTNHTILGIFYQTDKVYCQSKIFHIIFSNLKRFCTDINLTLQI